MPLNNLRHATSPYLLQHAENPVDWHEWSPETLAKAERLARPILLSIGYAACHWCHVMAHESFEDAATAAVMNELFINIKVDREERPDIDHIYMSALHAQGEQGGWPLTMFLTPKGEPFWGGTYFPKTAQYGRPGFVDLLRHISKTYHEKPDAIARNAQALTPARPVAASTFETITPDQIKATAQRFETAIDRVHGGLRGAPKFPNAPILDFLLRSSEAGETRNLVYHTLRQICAGGIYDHVGGGFARYSTDEFWLVPHFEKMLYDNAQLLDLLALAYHDTQDPIFKARAEQTVAWMQRELATPGGAFSASLDADSEGVEGRYYIWTASQIRAALGPGEADAFMRAYGASEQGNWHDEGTKVPVNILNRTDQFETLESEACTRALETLRHYRDARPRPGLDDKILADWNGLAIAALVHAATAFQRPEWLKLAQDAMCFVSESMIGTSPDGHLELGHSWRDQRLQKPGLASDYAFVLSGALALHEASFLDATPDHDWLGLAVQLADTVHAHYIDPISGLLCMSSDTASDVLVRLAPTQDDAIPNSHGHYLIALHQLAAHTGETKWRDRATALQQATTAQMAKQPFNHCGLMSALLYSSEVTEITLSGRDRQAWHAAALELPFQNRIILDGNRLNSALQDQPPSALFCVNRACALPITDFEAYKKGLAGIDPVSPD
ncbi:MAG: thioredoxin domain-containing protein [Hyphomicrobiales bacterium]|nr:thioredoxin domain-containing protein [Hyphomicrobiales bacterium]MDE2114122.1 thioredoxin domain-containing protein [Hyphomicrobiales bacterium]